MNNKVKKLNLTKEQYTALVNGVEKLGKDRFFAQGQINEADFFAGALAVYSCLGIPCPIWPIFIMTGRSLLGGRS